MQVGSVVTPLLFQIGVPENGYNEAKLCPSY
jgi:hypothetical protein